MKLGILADIHENIPFLRSSIDVLQKHGVDRFVVLGDVFEMGRHIAETTAILRDVAAEGVWGNHDFGLCLDVSDAVRGRYGEEVIDFMESLKPRLEIDGCLFTHVEPWLDPNKVEDLWYFEGPPDTAEKLARTFAVVPNRLAFVGHYHQWLIGSPSGLSEWRGGGPVVLDDSERRLVVIHAVQQGRCAMFDTATNEMTPFDVAGET